MNGLSVSIVLPLLFFLSLGVIAWVLSSRAHAKVSPAVLDLRSVRDAVIEKHRWTRIVPAWMSIKRPSWPVFAT